MFALAMKLWPLVSNSTKFLSWNGFSSHMSQPCYAFLQLERKACVMW
jgi:hypothetical protein